MKKLKQPPIGTSDFKSIIEDDCYYFDKTKLIEEIIKDKTKVKLFTRPRRFGKTLNMSMLRCFFDMERKEENKNLFKGLYIEQSEVFTYQGEYPVIYLSLKDIKQSTWLGAKDAIKSLLSDQYDAYLFVQDGLSHIKKQKFLDILMEKDTPNTARAIKFLCEFLYKHYQKKVILLIDEYDTPIISAHQEGYYDEAIAFFKEFLSTALKDNEYLEMAVLTGIVRVANENIFSGLNNIRVYTILDDFYADSFGLTEEEVESALDYYSMTENIEEVKAWYNGYKFGGLDIYNPWSIVNYLKDKKTGIYWINTSGNYLVKKALEVSNQRDLDELRQLMQGNSIEKDIERHASYIDINNSLESWQMLLFSGYLTVEKEIEQGSYSIRLTNKEVNSYFEKQFIQVNFGETSTFSKMMRAFVAEKFELFETLFSETMMSTVSTFDTRQHELVYHMYFLGMSNYLRDRFYIVSNQETGMGRVDISLEPKDKTKTGFIIEFKVADNDKAFEKSPVKAIEQIKSKAYKTQMRERGIEKIIAVGIAFMGKKVKVETEVLE